MLLSISWLLSYININDASNFLLLFTRFWELAIGSILAFSYDKFKSKSNLVSIIGLVLILFSFIFPRIISENQAIINLIPVIGTTLIIAYSPKNGAISRMCNNTLIKYIGLSSYSIYLFHQPILAFFRISSDVKPCAIDQLLVILLAIPLGYLSWYYIENRFRDKNIINNRIFYSAIFICFITFTSLGLVLNKTYGLQNNIPQFYKYSYGNNPQKYSIEVLSLTKSAFETNKPKMLIIGDSFSRDFYNSINEVGLTNGYEVIFIDKFNKDPDFHKLSTADLVFVASSAGKSHITPDEESLISNRKKLKDILEKHVTGEYFVIGTKNYGYNNNFIRLHDWEQTKDIKVDISKSALLVNEIEKSIFLDKYIDIIALTQEGKQTRIFTDCHKFISFDTGHLTQDGAKYIGSLIIKNTELANYFLE